jgi:imidazolonepropionase-like amidohydrolase
LTLTPKIKLEFRKFRKKPFLAMKNLALSILLIASSSLQAQEFLIKNANVIPMTGDNQVLENHMIHIKDGKILELSPTLDVNADSVIDAGGKYIFPGLAEMHSHIPVAQNGDFDYLQDIMWLYLANGILTVRGMIGHPSHLQLRDKIQRGEIVGPRIFAAGPSLNGNTVNSPEQGAAMVREQKAAGYDHLKLHPGLKMDEFLAIAEAAKEEGIKMGGHVSLDVGLRASIENGYHSVEHIDGYLEAMLPDETYKDQDKAGPFSMKLADQVDMERLPELIELSKEHDVYVAPTMSLFTRFFGYVPADEFKEESEMKYLPNELISQWVNQKQQLEKQGLLTREIVEPYLRLRDEILLVLFEEGVPLLMSSDSPQVFNVPGFSIHHELKAMKEAGIPEYEILKSGSVNVAQYFNAEKRFGQIQNGYEASFVMVNDNPLEDLETLKSIEGIMVDGKWLSQEKLQGELSRIAEKNKR